MSASKQIKQAMLEKNIKVSDLAEKIGMKPQPLSTKLYRDTMSYSDVEKIADALGCDVRIVDRATGKTFLFSRQQKRKMLFCHLPFTFIAYSIFLSLFLISRTSAALFFAQHNPKDTNLSTSDMESRNSPTAL